MIYQFGDRNVLFDSGQDLEGDILQRREPDGWQFYKPDGEFMRSPIDMNELPPGEYRLVSLKKQKQPS